MSRLTEYYRTLRERYGYDRPAFALGSLSEAEVKRRFVLADGLDSGIDPAEDVLVSTGVSVTGPPHVGTLGQFLSALALREAGFEVRVTLADFVVYHTSGAPIETVSRLAGRYHEFALALGFDSEELVVQSDARDVSHTAQLLARYDDPDGNEKNDRDDTPEPPAFERALADAYDAAGESPIASSETVEPTGFGRQQAGLLLAADQLHPLVAEGYDTVIFVGGADNHRLAADIRQLLDRSPYAGTLAGLYTRLISGYEGYPKLSKSIPPSRFTLDDSSERIRERIVASGTDPSEGTDPRDSIVDGMMALTSLRSADELDTLRDACVAGNERWNRAKREYADWLIEIGNTWRATG